MGEITRKPKHKEEAKLATDHFFLMILCHIERIHIVRLDNSLVLTLIVALFPRPLIDLKICTREKEIRDMS